MFNKNQTRYILLVIPLIANLIIIASGLTLVPTLAKPGRILAAIQANDPTPPPEETKPFLPDETSSPAAPTQEEIEMQAAMEALEVAQQQGPEAVMSLLGTLRGKALDIAMGDIHEAQEQLALSAPPPPESKPVSLAEEEAMQQDQQARDTANRTQALSTYTDPEENQSQIPIKEYPTIPNAPAANRTVGNGCTYPTIAAAIAAADPGDRLLIEGGVTFVENLIINKNLTLQGGYAGCASGNTHRTTVDGNASGSVVVVDPAIAVRLENLNITNGLTGSEGGGICFAMSTGTGSLQLTNIQIYANQGQWGGGLWVGSDAEVTGENVEIYNNTATTYGGGVRLYGSRITLSNSNINGNSAPYGGGIYATQENGNAPSIDLPTYAGIYQNTATTGDGLGGGVYLSQGTVSIAGCSDIYSNNAIEGGGAYLVTSTLTIQGNCSEIMLNTATGNGGGIRAQGSTVNLDQDAELYNNTAGTSGVGSGGGAYLDDSNLWGDKALIQGNTADDYGGGVYATNGSLLDMDLGGYVCTGPRCSQLSNNTASGYGGGVYASENSEVDLRQIFVENNSAVIGGGVYAYQSPVYLYNDLVARNNASGVVGDGLRLYTGSSLSGQNNTLAHNDTGGATTGNAIAMSGATLSLNNSIVWGHASGVPVGYTITCSDIQGGYTGADNLDVDPLFVNPASANFHLQNNSPVIDRCASGQTVDFDNEARPVTYIRPATPYDMGADETSMRVGINGGACAYGRIQDAVDAASPGDTIQAVADMFLETVDLSDRNITIVGGYDADCTTFITGTTTIDASLITPDNVFDINNSQVVLRNLNITGGNEGNGGGLSILNASQVTLDNTDVFDNQAGNGGGVYINPGCVLTITNDSDIHDNTALIAGGGVRVWGSLIGNNWASSIANNTAPDGGGVSVPGGTLELHGSHILNNDATAADGRGGGIHVYDSGVILLTSSSNVHNNNAYDGAGIYADNASIQFIGMGIIHSNNATNNGGGIYLANGSTLSANSAKIGHPANGWGGNTAINGAGLYVDSSTMDYAGNIQNNIASGAGGGLYANNSTISMTNVQMGGTEDYQANQLGPSGYFGAGLYLTGGTVATLDSSLVSSNLFQSTLASFGGGAYLSSSSVLTLTNSVVESHLAPSVSDGRGAGLYLNNSTVTLDNSQVISNTAGTAGGGIRLYDTSTLNVINGSIIQNNEALNGEGGGIAAGGIPDINISDATLQENQAGTDGGAIYLDNGTLDFTGGWTLRSNDASDNGGAVAIMGTSDADFSAQSYSLLYDNVANGGNGGAIYLNNNDTVQIHATGGSQLYIYANQASENGGALFADNGGYFDIYGQVNFDRNRADNGGAIYLSNNSQVWLDDYSTTGPMLWDNWADNGSGGAIYAQDSPRVECDGATFGRAGDGNHALLNGGALYLSGSTLNAENCFFLENQAANHGGAIAAEASSTLILGANFVSPLTVLAPAEAHTPEAPLATSCDPVAGPCSAFVSNVADSDANSSGHGGAIYTSDSTLQMDYTYLHRNSAYYGGAIFQDGASAAAQINNTLIYSNTTTYGVGAGIRASGGAFTMTHVTLANNVNGAAYSQSVSGVSSVVQNSIAWGNSSGGFLRTFVLAACNIDQEGNAGTNVDPRFADPGAGNYHLLGSSPAIDACTTGLTPDLEGIARPFGSNYDMGVYEYAAGITFSPNHSESGPPGSPISYVHTLTNAGGGTDTYTLSATSSQGWSVTIDPSPTVTLAGGESTTVTVTVNIPAGAAVDTVDTTVVSATSGLDPSLSATVTNTTTVIQVWHNIYLPLVMR